MELLDLPTETKFEIMYHLSYPDVLVACSTSRTMNEICETSHFWRKKVKLDFDIDLDTNEEVDSERYLQIATQNGNVYVGSERYEERIKLLTRVYLDYNTSLLNYFTLKNYAADDYDVLNLEFGPGRGFKRPVFLGPELVDFFRHSNLGVAYLQNRIGTGLREVLNDNGEVETIEEPAYEYVETDIPLRNIIRSVLEHPHIATSGNLTSLFFIYVDIHDDILIDTGRGLYIQADNNMKTRLRRILRTVKDAHPTFNEDSFRYPELQRIIKFGVIPADQLTPNQLQLMVDPLLKAQLLFEDKIFKATIKGLQQRRLYALDQ